MLHDCRFVFLIKLYFEIIVNSYAVVRNNTGRSCVLLTQFLHIVISCKAVVQYHNQDVGIDSQDTEHLFPSFLGSLICPPIVTPTSL